jgi:hypothetical protein
MIEGMKPGVLKFKYWIVSAAALFFLPVAAFAADAGALSGTYVLVEHFKGVEAADRIAFHADGSCVLEIDGQSGVAGKYQVDPDGKLTINPGGGKPVLAYHYSRGKITLILSRQNDEDLYYGLLPDQPPHLQFSDIVGIVTCHNEAGDSVCEITADHKFRVRLHDLSVAPGIAGWISAGPQGHVCYDVSMDGTCSYADGVTTYAVEHCDAAPPDQSLADVVIKRDEKGLWLIDCYHDQVICQPWGTKFELPAAPWGYKLEKGEGTGE